MDYTLKKSRRARRMWLTVQDGGNVVVTLPFGVPAERAADFVAQKRDWLLRTIARMAKRKDDIVLPRNRREYLRRKEEARLLVNGLLARFNAYYRFSFGRVAIKDLRRNWGSCSEAGNLNFNYKIVHLPPHLAEYLVIHELCHLGSFDHSPAYWALVERTVPDHKLRRRELRRYRP